MIMTNQKQELYNVIEDLPEELSNKVLTMQNILSFHILLAMLQRN